MNPKYTPIEFVNPWINFEKGEATFQTNNGTYMVEIRGHTIVRAFRWHRESQWTSSWKDGYRETTLDDVTKLAAETALHAVYKERESNESERRSYMAKNEEQRIASAVNEAVEKDRVRQENERNRQAFTNAKCAELRQRIADIEAENYEPPDPWKT